MPLAIFGPLDWAVLAGYFGLMFCIGHFSAKRKTDAEGYFLGGRRMPVFAVALSIVATSLSIATFVGVPQTAMTGDLTYLSQNLGVFIAAFVVATVFLPRFYAAGTVTPIMSPSRTIDASLSAVQSCVPAGRRGSTIQR